VPSPSLAVEHLFTIRFDTAPPVSAPGCPGGNRVLVNVTAGFFEGPRLRGTVVAASDWVTARPNGDLELDVRAQLRAEDTTTILMTYTGFGARGQDGSMSIRTTPRFEAPADGPHGWLNDVTAVATGALAPGSVTYEVYALA